MKNYKSYSFSLLKFCPSYVLGEQVNVGVLYFFPDENKAEFLYPTRLKRLKELFIDTDLHSIKTYLHHIKQLAKEISFDNGLLPNSTPEQLLTQYFGNREAVNVFFETPKQGIYTDKESLIKEHYSLFFSVYDNKRNIAHHDEKYIKATFERGLNEFKVSKELLQNKYSVQGKRAEIIFDYAWENGKLNLVQPLSFDVEEGQTIQNKSLLWFGRLTQIKQTIEQNKLHIDFLVAKPQIPHLHPYYKNAIENLHDVGGDLFQIHTEDHISKYVHDLSQNAHKKES